MCVIASTVRCVAIFLSENHSRDRSPMKRSPRQTSRSSSGWRGAVLKRCASRGRLPRRSRSSQWLTRRFTMHDSRFTIPCCVIASTVRCVAIFLSENHSRDRSPMKRSPRQTSRSSSGWRSKNAASPNNFGRNFSTPKQVETFFNYFTEPESFTTPIFTQSLYKRS